MLSVQNRTRTQTNRCSFQAALIQMHFKLAENELHTICTKMAHQHVTQQYINHVQKIPALFEYKQSGEQVMIYI